MVETEMDMILIKGILMHNKQMQNDFYLKYSDLVAKFLKVKYGNVVDIEDVVSETLIKVFNNLNKYNPERGSVKTWIYNIAKNHLIDKLRRECNKSYMNIHDVDVSSLSVKIGNSNEFDSCDMLEYVSNTIDNCDYTLLNMKYNLGYNYCEIGEEFNITSSTVSNKINYIKSKLKKNKEIII